ncbi:MAG: formamidopyrimidine-DNA glycosylase [Gemmatimonadetes bacterium]|nr:formamidopyrimidine-DNA glycosylase [Gemmatimonadota bacterium]
MPELPDIIVYLDALERHVVGHRLVDIRLASPFLLRSVDPPLSAVHRTVVSGVSRRGKRIVIGLQGDRFLVIHLMIAGRLRWREAGARIPGKVGLAAFDFDHGTLLFTEAGSKKRASLHLVQGAEALAQFDRGGLDVFQTDLATFTSQLQHENRTLKRALTDPRILDGIGNAYSDEILHRARLSPVKRTQSLSPEELERLLHAARDSLAEWIERLRQEVGDGFPDKVTAFRPGMAVHGRYGEPCPVCQTPVQRIRYASRETNYCAHCQTGGKLLADRALSRLLKDDWPRRLEDLE